MKSISKKLSVLIITGVLLLGVTTTAFASAEDPNDPPRPGTQSYAPITIVTE